MEYFTPTAAKRAIKRDFTPDTQRMLAQRGITLLRATYIPGDGPLPFATGQRAYEVSDNGCGRVMTHPQILEAARA